VVEVRTRDSLIEVADLETARSIDGDVELRPPTQQ
jgi:hypothetical protein